MSFSKSDIVRIILAARSENYPALSGSKAFAPTNIALCKYWGKRNQELNLPVTSSLSISLRDKGATVELQVTDNQRDTIILNGTHLNFASAFGQRLAAFLDLFRTKQLYRFHVDIYSTVPIAAGLASSACGFASLVQALNELFAWKLQPHELSILARLGSGSAARSIWTGFAEWQQGERDDGMDSYATPLESPWPELCIGLLVISNQEKNISSREAMLRTVTTSQLYSAWPSQVKQDLLSLKTAIATQDFSLLGKTAEVNAMSMHATMLSAWPPISYYLPATLTAMQKIWETRYAGLPLYFTQDAGPNLKLLFLAREIATVKTLFPEIEVVQPFTTLN